jgi:DinB family protein
MTRQPAPKVTSADVERIVRRDFPRHRIDEVFTLLAGYGIEDGEPEPDRVRLAVLKLSEGSIEQLRYHIAGAKCDFREVLSPAEYPGYTKRMFRISKLPADQRKRIIDADWKQYQDWLERPDAGGVKPPDIQDLHDQLDAAERVARSLVAGLSEEQGNWRAEASSWSVAECLDHLAIGNRVYLQAMEKAAARARKRGRTRYRPARPGWAGRLFAWTLEPPPRRLFMRKAPRSVRPRSAPPLADTFASFIASQADCRAFLHAYADLDLTGIRFRNPFVPIIYFSLATGLHVIVAHERRHLWQAWRVRRALESQSGEGARDR